MSQGRHGIPSQYVLYWKMQLKPLPGSLLNSISQFLQSQVKQYKKQVLKLCRIIKSEGIILWCKYKILAQFNFKTFEFADAILK